MALNLSLNVDHLWQIIAVQCRELLPPVAGLAGKWLFYGKLMWWKWIGIGNWWWKHRWF